MGNKEWKSMTRLERQKDLNRRGRKLRATGKRRAKASMAKKKNPESVNSIDGWIPAHAVRILPDGKVQILKENSGRKINFGYKDVSGAFHSLTSKVSKGVKRVTKKNPKRRKNPAKVATKTIPTHAGTYNVGDKITTIAGDEWRVVSRSYVHPNKYKYKLEFIRNKY